MPPQLSARGPQPSARGARTERSLECQQQQRQLAAAQAQALCATSRGGPGWSHAAVACDPHISMPTARGAAPPPVAPLNLAPLAGGGGALTARGMAAPGSGGGFASPRTTNFLMALSQAYYQLHPHGNGWLPSRQLYDPLCFVNPLDDSLMTPR